MRRNSGLFLLRVNIASSSISINGNANSIKYLTSVDIIVKLIFPAPKAGHLKPKMVLSVFLRLADSFRLILLLVIADNGI